MGNANSLVQVLNAVPYVHILPSVILVRVIENIRRGDMNISVATQVSLISQDRQGPLKDYESW